MILKIEINIEKFINKCINSKINILDIEYHEKYALIRIDKRDYKRIKRLSYYTKIDTIKYTGLAGVKRIIKKYLFDFLMIFLFIGIIYIQSNVIVKVTIKHENKVLKEKIDTLIKEKGIKHYTIVKSNKELNEISDLILSSNRDILDFISITRNGMTYTVSLEERIIKSETKDDTYCHIKSNKDAIVKKITTYKGISLIEKNQSVKKGDILISGDLILNEEIKNNVCADGIVIGESWYKINVSYPLEIQEEYYTDKHKYNLSINNRLLLKNKYELYKIDNKFKFLNIKIIDIKEKNIKTIKYTKEEAIKLAIKKAEKELSKEKDSNFKIIDEKVLKVNEFNSKIELELFLSVEENIGIKELGDLSDTEQSVRHTN